MKNHILFAFFLLGATSSFAQTQVAPYLCHFSIMKPNGSIFQCNGMHIGGGRILTASHCFAEGKKIITDGIVLAKCGNDEISEFNDLKKTDKLPLGTIGEDFAQLKFAATITAGAITPTSYPAMYFEGGQLKASASCEILAFRGEYPSNNMKRIVIDSSMRLTLSNAYGGGPIQIGLVTKSGAPISADNTVVPGDSGGALVCRYMKNARPELIGVIMTSSSDRTTNAVTKNAFSPVFGVEALRILGN